MRIDRLQDLLQRLLADTPPDRLQEIVPIDDTQHRGHRRLGGSDLVTYWTDRPDRAALDAQTWAALENAQHPEIASITRYDTDNEWFGRDGAMITFTDGSHGHVRFLPGPDRDSKVLIIRLIGTSPPGGGANREDHDGVPEKTRMREEVRVGG